MCSLQQLADCWNVFFFAPVPVYPVALMRICLGLVLLTESLFLITNAKDYFGPDGLISYERYYRRTNNKSLSLFLYLPSGMTSVYAIMSLHIVSLMFMVMGLFTQISVLIAFITLVSIVNRNPTICNGGDNVSRIMCFLLIFTSSGKALSLDEYFFYSNHLHSREYVMQAPWAMRLMQIQLSIIYLYKAYWKLKGTTYRNGTAMYYVMGNFGYRRFLLPKPLLRKPSVYILTWSVLVVESAIPLGLWITDFRYFAIALGFTLHIAIEYLVNVHLFSYYMMASLLLFIDPYDLMKWIHHF